MIKIITGKKNPRAIIKAKGIEDSMTKGIRRGFFSWGDRLIKIANKNILKKPRHGRVYIRRTKSGRRRRHVASVPGESHANYSGTLRKSLGWKIRGSSELEFGYGVASSRAKNQQAPDYADYMENGTPNKKIKPRPTLKIAIRSTEGTAEKFFSYEIKKLLSK